MDKKRTVLSIYYEVMKDAREISERNGGYATVVENWDSTDLARYRELMHFAAQLEATEEVNPSK